MDVTRLTGLSLLPVNDLFWGAASTTREEVANFFRLLFLNNGREDLSSRAALRIEQQPTSPTAADSTKKYKGPGYLSRPLVTAFYVNWK